VSCPPLDGIRVLELAQGVAGPYAARLLGDLGAEVVKVEPPSGDPARGFGPFWRGQPHPEHSGLYLYLNAGKQGVVLDLSRVEDRAMCFELAATVDIVFESFPRSDLDGPGLNLDRLRRAQPALVLVSVSPFGKSGPRASWLGNDLIACHSGGFAHSFPSLQVDAPDLAPLNLPTYAAEFLAGQTAAAAALHGLLVAQRTGLGSHVDVSAQEAIAAANNSGFNRPPTTGAPQRVFSSQPSNATVALLPCLDGWVAISPREEHQWARWLEVMGGPVWASDPRFADRAAREKHWSALFPLLAEWTSSRTRVELFEAAQAQRVACYPLATATELLASPQLAHRDFFIDPEDPELAGVVLPGRPYHLSEVVAPPPARAPRLGEHTAQVLAELRKHPPLPLGEAARSAGEGDLPAGETSARTSPSPQPSPRGRGSLGSPLRPLEGLRVVDFSWVLTGPICTRYLAALGAEVIKVESAARADLSHRDLAWEALNFGKRSITLNLKLERARELARALIARSDVVVENFSTGVMERLGLDYPRLRAINPRLIMASSSAHGRTGPDRERVAYGTLIQCFTGWAELSAHPGRPPRSAAGVWTDPLTAVFETLLVLVAVWRQRASGTGGFYDLSMAETTIAALPEPILAWCLNREVLQPRGNRHPSWAPQGCYPAQGVDRWVALSVQSDAEWASLCGLMGRADLLGDTSLATADGRRQHHDVIDMAIAAWTGGRPGDVSAASLQAHGIAATATLEPAELVNDVHLTARSFMGQVERLDGGTQSVPGVPWLIEQQRPNAFRRPPRLGEDNLHVFQDLLGLSDAEYAQLLAEQVIY
jgi:crotonobetainyl-CoA:carnitine CoA-transferase CaiB-like acyl-CoA transferase